MIEFNDIHKTAIKSGIFLSISIKTIKVMARDYILLTILDKDHHEYNLYYASETLAKNDYGIVLKDDETTKVVGFKEA